MRRAMVPSDGAVTGHGVGTAQGLHRVVTPAPVSRNVSSRPQRSTGLNTMAPDKSHLVTNLNELLRLTDSSVDPDAAMLRPPKHSRGGSASPPPPGVVRRAQSSAAVEPVLASSNSNGMRSGDPSPSTQQPNTVVVTQPRQPAVQQLDVQQSAYGLAQAEPQGPLSVRFDPTASAEEYHPSDGWRPRPHHLSQAELWERIREEARMDSVLEPVLATFLHSVILSHNSMEAAMAFLLANKLADGTMLGSVQLMSLFREAYAADSDILAAGIADMHAVLDRDPACSKFTQCMLQFKGYQAVQCYRITHHLWNQGRQALALAISVRVSELFAVDIHPAAVIGRGVMLDHATGIVIGETAVVGDNVSMLHHVSLGGSGTCRGARHPRIGHGVLLGAGVAVLGPVTVGAGSKVGAGSVVVSDLPDHCVAVGVPARIVKRNLRAEPVREMDQCADFILDYVI